MKTQVLLSLIAIVSASVLASAMADNTERKFFDVEEADSLFEEFIQKHDKQYKDENDRQVHLNNFKDNLKKINELNKQGNAVYGINKFSDLSPEEMKAFRGLRKN